MMYFVGGCHVTGYPVGYEHSFVNKINLDLGIEVCAVRRPISIKNSLKEIKSLCLNGKKDSLVLQLGNYEASFSIFPSFLKNKANTSGVSNSFAIGGELYAKKNVNSFIFDACRIPILHLYDLLKISIFDKNLIRYQLIELFDWLSENFHGKVYILSAFPSLSPATNIYRKWISNLLKTMSFRYKFTYVDVYRVLSSGKYFLADFNLFADKYHLNSRGQNVVGNVLGNAVLIDNNLIN